MALQWAVLDIRFEIDDLGFDIVVALRSEYNYTDNKKKDGSGSIRGNAPREDKDKDEQVNNFQRDLLGVCAGLYGKRLLHRHESPTARQQNGMHAAGTHRAELVENMKRTRSVICICLDDLECFTWSACYVH